MHRNHCCISLLFLLLGILPIFPLLGPSPLRGDSFLLKTGARLEGEWLNPKRKPDDSYELKTTEGMKLELSRDQVVKVFVESEVQLQYKKLLPRMPATAMGNWQMAQWCKDAGLRAEREAHLRAVIELEPDHAEARLALGYQRFDGVWRTAEEHMSSLGYVRYQGRWATPQDVALAERESAINSEVVEWRKNIRVWKSWIGRKRDSEARENFRGIHDPQAAPELIELLEETDNPLELRLLALESLAVLPERPGESTFIALGVEDQDDRLRDRCIEWLAKYESKRAVFRYVELLKNKDNLKVNRAARALGMLQDPLAIPGLIDALVTTHEFMVIPGASSGGGLGPINSSFGRDPSSGGIGDGGGGMSFGAPRPVKEKRDFRNDAVLGALTTLAPNVNFVFDEAAWKRWYLDENQPAAVNLRRGN